jgi:SAM-dependent methyltransferase
MSTRLPEPLDQFRRKYAEHRAQEGRGYSGAELLSLPYLASGPLAQQWAVRARTFDALVGRVVDPIARSTQRPLRILDLGAGNGWLCHRLAQLGHDCAAVDIREDSIDGLGAAAEFLDEVRFECFAASFDSLPMADSFADLTVFNAALHYSTSLEGTLAEAVRVTRRGGVIAILDSPFYAREAQGAAMVAEKHADAAGSFGNRATSLLALPFIEYLTRGTLARASRPLGLTWRRHRVLYPLWYELRPLAARLKGKRAPSRFDLWTAERP